MVVKHLYFLTLFLHSTLTGQISFAKTQTSEVSQTSTDVLDSEIEFLKQYFVV